MSPGRWGVGGAPARRGATVVPGPGAAPGMSGVRHWSRWTTGPVGSPAVLRPPVDGRAVEGRTGTRGGTDAARCGPPTGATGDGRSPDGPDGARATTGGAGDGCRAACSAAGVGSGDRPAWGSGDVAAGSAPARGASARELVAPGRTGGPGRTTGGGASAGSGGPRPARTGRWGVGDAPVCAEPAPPDSPGGGVPPGGPGAGASPVRGAASADRRVGAAGTVRARPPVGVTGPVEGGTTAVSEVPVGEGAVTPLVGWVDGVRKARWTMVSGGAEGASARGVPVRRRVGAGGGAVTSGLARAAGAATPGGLPHRVGPPPAGRVGVGPGRAGSGCPGAERWTGAVPAAAGRSVPASSAGGRPVSAAGPVWGRSGTRRWTAGRCGVGPRSVSGRTRRGRARSRATPRGAWSLTRWPSGVHRVGSWKVPSRSANRSRSVTSTGAGVRARWIGGRLHQAGSAGPAGPASGVGPGAVDAGAVAAGVGSGPGDGRTAVGPATRARVSAASRRILSRSPIVPH
ncbi:hypothetical protein GA0074694_5320 [Micromonospora inyonensis]|uniref:Uncharacterized protein n=1 Tax=Micromonospora inyonensis TaxID=47866 RepID=A0A1C6SII9_9ACTN|nr:hypothetical protein GA0074694_5320 [Micromonospora inyonensis]